MYSDIKDLAGRKIGHWIILEDVGRASNNEVMWKCRCTCGAIRDVRGAKIRQGKSQSCGCTTEALDISGDKFGKWKVLGRTRDNMNIAQWLCQSGGMYVMLDTVRLKRRSVLLGKTGKKGAWRIVGRSGDVIKKFGCEWVLASECPKVGMIVAECTETGITAVFDQDKYDANNLPPNLQIAPPKERVSGAKDLSNMVFKTWKVLYREGCNKHGQAIWTCECQECGLVKDIVGFAVKRGTGCRNCNKLFGNGKKQGSKVTNSKKVTDKK